LFAPPDEETFGNARSKLNDQLNSAAPADKPAVQAKLDQLDKERHDADLKFSRRMFWVCYVAGIISVCVGLFIPVRAVGAGLMFGGISAISEGCYNVWDKLAPWLRFNSLLFLLIVFLVLSLVRFRSPGKQVTAALQ
jgi:type VI protein secretion system component VasF